MYHIMNLRRRKYSEVKHDFILSTSPDSSGNLKQFIKKIPIWGIIFILFGVGKSYWDNGYIDFESLKFYLIGLGVLGGFMLIIYLIQMAIPHHAFVGIHPEGIWLWNQQVGDIGFLEWGWIKEIDVSSEYQIVYIVVYDMESIKKDIIKGIHKMGFNSFVVASNGNEKALKIPLNDFSPEMFDYIDSNNLAIIQTIE